MVYVRGHKLDYAAWERLGAKGWGYKDVLPYFKKAETWYKGANEWRGDSGPLHVKFGSNPTKTREFFIFILSSF
jgi:choline dehydrogenase